MNLRKREHWVPTAAVAAVAVAALSAALMVQRADTALSGPPVLGQVASNNSASQKSAAVAPSQPASEVQETTGVIKAPPLKPAPKPTAQARGTPPRTTAMGAPAACRNCGVVEMVVAVHDYENPTPSGYQMHIRMDDGSLRTVEQRGALAAGSRVVVEGSAVRALSNG